MDYKQECVFCSLSEEKIILQTESFIAINDRHPVKLGHMLIISRRHAETIFDLDKEEFSQLHEMIQQVKTYLENKHEPDGYNLGANCGSVAGQSIHHFHMHVIPRYKKDERLHFYKNSLRNIREYHLN